MNSEWIKLISTQSNAVCDESSKKTISPEHVTEALKVRLLELIAAQRYRRASLERGSALTGDSNSVSKTLSPMLKSQTRSSSSLRRCVSQNILRVSIFGAAFGINLAC